MKRRIVIALATGALLLGGTSAFAEEQKESKPPMHMHKSDMDHRSDKDVATEYQDEASQLRGKAESHRKLAKMYRGRTPPKGAANYANVVKHCEKLAQYYEDAAREAEGVAAELSK
jgi:hypothetical protein